MSNLTFNEVAHHAGIVCTHRAVADAKTVYLVHQSRSGNYRATRIETTAKGTIKYWIGEASTVALVQKLCQADHAAS